MTAGCDDVPWLNQLVGGGVVIVGNVTEFQLKSGLEALAAKGGQGSNKKN
jgi:hypothetical protein